MQTIGAAGRRKVSPQPVTEGGVKKRKQGRPAMVDNPKERIRENAAEQFARQGYEKSSINELAKSLKISKAAIYHYYKTKQEIYDEIIVITLRGMIEKVETATQGVSDPAQRLEIFMSSHAQYFEQHYWQFVTMLMGFGGMVNIDRKKDTLKLRDHYENYLRKIISDGIKSGKFCDQNVNVVARAIISMLGWMARWYHPGGRKTAEDVAREYYHLLMGGLAVDPRKGTGA